MFRSENNWKIDELPVSGGNYVYQSAGSVICRASGPAGTEPVQLSSTSSAKWTTCSAIVSSREANKKKKKLSLLSLACRFRARAFFSDDLLGRRFGTSHLHCSSFSSLLLQHRRGEPSPDDLQLVPVLSLPFVSSAVTREAHSFTNCWWMFLIGPRSRAFNPGTQGLLVIMLGCCC